MHYFCNLHFSTNEHLLFSSYSIGNINPFRWKSHYYDVESGLYYANGSYYDPEVGQYVDASPIEAVEENAYINHSLDRNNILCNNVFLLVAYLCGIFTIEDLSPDPTYDPLDDETWFSKLIYKISNWYKGIHWSVKLVAGVILLVAAIVLTIATEGAAAVPMLLANVAIGTAIGVASWALMTLLAGEALTWEGALNAFLNSFLLYAFAAFMATCANAVKHFIRAKQVVSNSVTTINNNNTKPNNAPRKPSFANKSTHDGGAKTLVEQLALEEVKSNPLNSAVELSKIQMNDPRWPGSEGWVKMQTIVSSGTHKTNVHFVYNKLLNLVDDFKIKIN